MRQPDDVFVSVAVPVASGTRSVGPSAAWSVSAEVPESSTVTPTPTASTSATATPADDEDLYDWGFVVQGAYLLKSNWEPFARYEYLHFDEAGLPAGSENDVHVITGGVNWYIRGHDAKFTFDLMYLPDGSPVADDGAGILASDGNSELIFRAQFQLLL